jgi:hypothetical protein
MINPLSLSVQHHDRARRFITFVDEVYDAGKILRWTSDTEPSKLFEYLRPEDMDSGEASLGTDHAWSRLNGDVINGETPASLGQRGAPETYEKAPFDSPSLLSMCISLINSYPYD